MEEVPFKKIGDYKCLKQIGHGGSGNVYLVENQEGKAFAAKVIMIDQKKDKEKDKALNEVSLLCAFKNPNIVEISAFFPFFKDTYIAIIMDYCPGGNLRRLIGIKDEGKIKIMMIEIAKGIQYLHQKNITHRDLKPENIFVGEGGTLKIGDFGIAKMMDKQLTLTIIQGTKYYRDQLQLKTGAEYGKQIDIWSLGIIYVELITGRNIYDLTKKEPKDITNFIDYIKPYIQSKEYLNLLSGMLNKNAAQRFKISKVLKHLKGQMKDQFPIIIDEIQDFSKMRKVYQQKFHDCQYTGKLIGKSREGFGKCEYISGDIYEGQFRNNMRDGKGQCKYKNGDYYTGEWRNDKFDGEGQQRLNSQPFTENYKGHFEHGQRNGRGRAQLSNGYSYDGEWRNGEFHGKGIQKYPDGKVFIGEFKYNQREGQGSLKYPESFVLRADYEGEWRNGKMNGQGSLRTDNYSYHGEFKDNQMSGKGIFIDSKGISYEGEFRNNKKI